MGMFKILTQLLNVNILSVQGVKRKRMKTCIEINGNLKECTRHILNYKRMWACPNQPFKIKDKIR